MHQNAFAAGAALQTPLGKLSSPDSLAGFGRGKGEIERARDGKGTEGEGKEEKGKE